MDVRARKRDIPTVIALRLKGTIPGNSEKKRQKDVTEPSDEYVCFYCFVIYVPPLPAN